MKTDVKKHQQQTTTIDEQTREWIQFDNRKAKKTVTIGTFTQTQFFLEQLILITIFNDYL